MKKTLRKLVLRSETLRMLADTDLARVVGGLESGPVQYPAALETGDKQCSTGVAATTTAYH